MTDKKTPKAVSKWYSDMAKKRTDGNYNFKDKEAARLAGAKGAAARWAKVKAQKLEE